MFRYLIATICAICLLSCHTVKKQDSLHLLDFEAFTIDVPASWEKLTLRGMDSYIGGIKIDATDSVSFDLGMYSFSLNDENSESRSEVIDGYQSKIVTPRKPGKGITGIYIDSLNGAGFSRHKFNLYGHDLSLENQQKFLKAIRTLKFRKRK